MSELIPHEVATKMMLAVGWNPEDFRVRDKISIAVAEECERRNQQPKANGPKTYSKKEGFMFNEPEVEVRNPLLRYLH